MSRRERYRLARATCNGLLASLLFARRSGPLRLVGDTTSRPLRG